MEDFFETILDIVVVIIALPFYIIARIIGTIISAIKHGWDESQ